MIEYYKKTLRDKEVKRADTAGTGVWVSLTSPTEKEIREISTSLGIRKDFLTAPLDEQEVSRIEVESDCLLVIYKLPVKNENPLSSSTLPLGIILTKNNIISVLSRPHPLINDFIEGKIKNFFTTTSTRFLLQFLFRINYYFANDLKFLDQRIEATEEKLLSTFENKEVVELLRFQKSLTYFNTAVLTNHNVLEKLMKGTIVKLYEEDQDLLEDTLIENRQSLETINVYSTILASTLDAYASIVSNNLNVVMKFLTSVTIMISLPNLIASIYGMNINLPFQNHPSAFNLILIVSLLVIMVSTLFFTKKRYF